MNRMKISPVLVVRYFDEKDPRSPAIRPDPPKTCLKNSLKTCPEIRTVAQILKELRNASIENPPENNMGIRI